MTVATTAATPGIRFDRDGFEQFLSTRSEPAWVTERRRAAFDHFEQLQSTPLDPEEWKRVDLRIFQPERFALQPSSQHSVSDPTVLQSQTEFAGVVEHVDGRCGRLDVADELAQKGILFGDLATLINEHGERIQEHLMTRAVRPETDRFAAWHAAFWTGGTLLYVPRGVQLDLPLHSLITLAQDAAADLSHTLVILEDGAAATLLEETRSASPEHAGLHVGAVELLIGNDAHLRYVQLQDWNQHVFHFAHQCGRVERNGSLQWTVGAIGARIAHVHQDVILDGIGATGEVNGVTFGTERQLLSYYTQQTHNAPETQTDLLYKTVLRDRARAVWRGMIRVEPQAQRINGYQRCDSLMLSEHCRTDSVPGLEIEADDVRCTHAATAGQVDEEQIFYCMSRGVGRREAMHMIVEGFFHDVYDRIPVPAVRETLSTAVGIKLGIRD